MKGFELIVDVCKKKHCIYFNISTHVLDIANVFNCNRKRLKMSKEDEELNMKYLRYLTNSGKFTGPDNLLGK